MVYLWVSVWQTHDQLKRMNDSSNSKKCHKWKQSIKLKLITLYGSCCCKCGYNDPRALQLDHVNGTKVKQGNYRRGGNGLYFLVLNGKVPKDDYQLLCANCNWIKRYEKNESSRRIK
jgi:hypothetical protein